MIANAGTIAAMPSRQTLLPAALLVLALAGCNGASPSTDQAPARETAPSEAAPADPSADANAVPVIASDEATFDFGSVAPSESVTHVFKLVNRGTADLHIEKVERT